MDIASADLCNILRVKPGEDLEDIYDGNFVYLKLSLNGVPKT